MGTHQSARSETVTWLTPPTILEALGKFDLDPCAAPDPKPWSTAEHHYTLPHQNGLILPWFGRVWLNPPYSVKETKIWLSKLARHNRGTALIFARTETRTFFNEVWEKASSCLFIRNRIFFHTPDGKIASHNSGAPSVLVSYGKNDAEILYESNIDGKFVPLTRPLMIYVAIDIKEDTKSWREHVIDAIRSNNGSMTLTELYKYFDGHPKTYENNHWREKIRQTVSRAKLKKNEQFEFSLA